MRRALNQMAPAKPEAWRMLAPHRDGTTDEAPMRSSVGTPRLLYYRAPIREEAQPTLDSG